MKVTNGRYYFTKLEVCYADRTIASFIYQLLKRYKKAKRVHYPGYDEAETPEEWEAMRLFAKFYSELWDADD